MGGPAEPAPDVLVLAAALRMQRADLDLYAGFLQNTLEVALPPELVTVERAPSMADRLRKRPGPVAQIAVTLGDRRYVLTGGSPPRAEIVHHVRGIDLDRTELPLDAFATALATAIGERAASDARAAAALARLTDPARQQLEG
ncbi:MAG: hypothetical protein JWM48_1705 [Mycobacterium sp.]|jgi:hypothetical protein|nr:hypothetical protein [Mycobacterium sp.]MCW2745155.1 hypothetical protein [Mycobacterium sp.]